MRDEPVDSIEISRNTLSWGHTQSLIVVVVQVECNSDTPSAIDVELTQVKDINRTGYHQELALHKMDTNSISNPGGARTFLALFDPLKSRRKQIGYVKWITQLR